MFSQQRKLCKRLENLTVAYDNTVRDASSRVVQFLYGEDSLDAVHIVRLPIPPLCPPYNYFFDGLDYDDEQIARHEQTVLIDAQKRLQQWKSTFREKLVSCAVDLEAILERAQLLSKKKCTESFRTMWTAVQDLINKCDIPLFKDVIQMYFQLKVVMQLESQWAFWMFEEIGNKLGLSKVAPGEMVGVLAAQSVSVSVQIYPCSLHPFPKLTAFDFFSHRNPQLRCKFINFQCWAKLLLTLFFFTQDSQHVPSRRRWQ